MTHRQDCVRRHSKLVQSPLEVGPLRNEMAEQRLRQLLRLFGAAPDLQSGVPLLFVRLNLDYLQPKVAEVNS